MAEHCQALLRSSSPGCPLLLHIAEQQWRAALKGAIRIVLVTGRGERTPFDASCPSDMPLADLMVRWARLTRSPSTVAVLAGIYLQRLVAARCVVISTSNVHRLFVTALTIAHKWHTDRHYKNSDYAQVLPGLTGAKLNKLERCMLRNLDFDVSVSESQLLSAAAALLCGRAAEPASAAELAPAVTVPRSCSVLCRLQTPSRSPVSQQGLTDSAGSSPQSRLSSSAPA